MDPKSSWSITLPFLVHNCTDSVDNGAMEFEPDRRRCDQSDFSVLFYRPFCPILPPRLGLSENPVVKLFSNVDWDSIRTIGMDDV